MPHYLRARIPGGTYFFTVALLERKRQLLTAHIDSLRAALRCVQAERPFHIDAIVILPDHLHCLWTLPEGDVDYPTRWRLIKSAFSRSLPAEEFRSDRRQAKCERGIWQRRYWEHAIREPADFDAHFHYIHYNPVKHGRMRLAVDWPHASFHRYVQAGVYDPARAADPQVQRLNHE